MRDLIDRQKAIDAVRHSPIIEVQPAYMLIDKGDVLKNIVMLPSAQPEYRMDEWCTDCKEYDHERHCCPRFNRVIRTTLQEAQAEQPEIIRCKDCVSYGEMLTGRDTRMICHKFALNFPRDFYCADAERRTDGSD